MFVVIPCLSLKKRSYHDVTETIGKSCFYLCSVYSSILPFITDRWRVNSFLIGHCRYREQLITKRTLMNQTKHYPFAPDGHTWCAPPTPPLCQTESHPRCQAQSPDGVLEP